MKLNKAPGGWATVDIRWAYRTQLECWSVLEQDPLYFVLNSQVSQGESTWMKVHLYCPMLHYALSLAVCMWHTPSPHCSTNAHWTLCSWIYLMTLCQPRSKFALYATKLASNRVEVTWILYSANKLPKMYLVLSHHRPGETLKVPGVWASQIF